MDNDDPDDDDDILQKLWNIRYERYMSWCYADRKCIKAEARHNDICEKLEVLEWSLEDRNLHLLSVEQQELYPQYLVILKTEEKVNGEDLVKCRVDAFMDSVGYEQADWNYQVYKEEKDIGQAEYLLQDFESKTQDLVEDANEELEIEFPIDPDEN